MLALLDADGYATLTSRVERLSSGLAEAIGASGIAVQVPVCRSLFSVYFSAEPVRDYEGAKRAASSGIYAPFFRAMLARGVALAPSPYEVGFTSLAHSEADIDRTIDAAGEAAREVAAHLSL